MLFLFSNIRQKYDCNSQWGQNNPDTVLVLPQLAYTRDTAATPGLHFWEYLAYCKDF